jgi:uncharacterized protein (TIGR03067 family)
LAFIAVAAQQPPRTHTPAATRVLQRLQGTWRFESMEQDGKKLAADDLKGRTLFVGGDVLFIRDGDKVLYGGHVSLDPSKSPPSINVSAQQGADKAMVDLMIGIYELDGDVFKLAFVGRGEERPGSFVSAPGSKVRLATCRRVRPTGETVDIVGTYKSKTLAPDGKTLEYDAQIERRGDGYVITYRNNNVIVYVGVGVRQGDTLSVAWGRQNQVGVSQYKIEKGPRLVGTYTMLGGPGLLLTEVLTKAVVID